MTWLQHMVISNVLFASALSPVVWGLTRVWRNRHVAHLLWVMVLAKLVTPPMWYLPIPIEQNFATRPSDGGTQDHLDIGLPAMHPTREATDDSVFPTEFTPPDTIHSEPPLELGAAIDWSAVAMWAWGISSALCLLVVLTRVLRFHRLVLRAEPATALRRERVEFLSRKMGLRRTPDVLLFDAAISPMVWPLARKQLLLLPKKLVRELTGTQLDTVIAHELAHVARRDDLVRFLETAVTCLFWWNPLVWLARRELRAAEEDCCDAIVVCSMPESRREYGEALLRAAELITFGRSLPGLASAIGQKRLLKRRIEVVLKHELHRSASWQAKLLLLLLALCILPISATAMSQEERPPAKSVESETANDSPQSGAQSPEAAAETRFDAVLREADRRMKQLALSHDDDRQTGRAKPQKEHKEGKQGAETQPQALWWFRPEPRSPKTMSQQCIESIRILPDGRLRSRVERPQESKELGQTQGTPADADKPRKQGVEEALEAFDKEFQDAGRAHQRQEQTLGSTIDPTSEGQKGMTEFLLKSLRNVESPSRQGVERLNLEHEHPLRADFDEKQMLRVIRHVDMTDEDLRRLAELVQGEVLRIESLRISFSSITDEGLRELARLKDLTALDLSHCAGVSDSGWLHLSELHNLRSLRIDGPLSDKAAQRLNLPKLRELVLTSSWVSEQGAAQLLGRLDSLRSLHISGPQFGDNTLAAIAELDRLEVLTTSVATFASDDLRLRGSGLQSVRISAHPDEGLARLKRLRRLRQLNLTVYSSINEEVVDQLSQLTRLEKLYINTRGFNDGHLAKLKTLTNLKNLSLRASTVSTDGIARLKEELPNLQVRLLD